MNIYLPYKSYKRCAAVLDINLLERQRRNAEVLIQFMLYRKKILEKLPFYLKDEYKKIKHSPIFAYWWNGGKPFVSSLIRFWDACNFELFNRKRKLHKIHSLIRLASENASVLHPGDPCTPKRITSGYRMILLTLNTPYYLDTFYITYKNNKKTIESLKMSKDKLRFSKLLGLVKT